MPIALMGAQTLADRLLHDGRTVMPARAGLQMCAVLDAAGAVAPWHAYMTAHDHEAESDNTSYGAESDRAVELAYLRGRLRLSPTLKATGEQQRKDGPDRSVLLDGIAEWLEERGDQSAADAVVKTLLDTVGIEAVTDLISRLATGGPVCLALAEQIAAGAVPEEAGSAADWAQEAADLGYVLGTGHRLLALGVSAADLAEGLAAEETSTARDTLFSLTREVQNEQVQWSPVAVARWLDALAITAQTDSIGLDAVPALVQGPGWYPCWLRFAIALARAEAAAAHTRSGLVIEALGLLTADLSPFTGSPRACDLYSIHPLIEESVRRTAALVSDQDWPQAWKTLIHVSREISVSLRGEMGGPLPADTLLMIAVEHATPARRAGLDEASATSSSSRQADASTATSPAASSSTRASPSPPTTSQRPRNAGWRPAASWWPTAGTRTSRSTKSWIRFPPWSPRTRPGDGHEWRASSHCANAWSITPTARRPTPPALGGGRS